MRRAPVREIKFGLNLITGDEEILVCKVVKMDDHDDIL